MNRLTQPEWKTLRLQGNVVAKGMTFSWDEIRLEGIHHVVHTYANFISSAEMVTTGQHLGKGFDPPVNSHLFHIFLVNCRAIADFLSNQRIKEDDVIAGDYAPDFSVSLPVCDQWRSPVNKQLPHITYTRVVGAQEITGDVNLAMYEELRTAWKQFRTSESLSSVFAGKFGEEITTKLTTEFQGLDLW